MFAPCGGLPLKRMKFVSIALFLGLAANAAAILSGRAVDNIEDVEEINPRALAMMNENRKKLKAQAEADAQLRKKTQSKVLEAIKIQGIADANAQKKKKVMLAAKAKADDELRAKVQAERKKARQAQLQLHLEEDRAARQAEKEVQRLMEHKQEVKALALQKREKRIRDEEMQLLATTKSAEAEMRQKKMDNAALVAHYERVQKKRQIELRQKEQVKQADAQEAATNL